jgi:hypothetical protein
MRKMARSDDGAASALGETTCVRELEGHERRQRKSKRNRASDPVIQHS